MPVESVDMFSGLDLPGFAPAAESAAEPAQAGPELTQSGVQPLVQRRCSTSHLHLVQLTAACLLVHIKC